MELIRVGVIGGSGYIGGELLRLLFQHPHVQVNVATSRQYKGEYVFRVHPNLRGFTELKFTEHKDPDIANKVDLLFIALPHGESVKYVPSFAEVGLKIIDLSADFRLKNPSYYKIWYGFDHPEPDLLQKFVYSIPELNRDEIRNARLASSPGCMAITSILALAPLVKQKEFEIDRTHTIIDAKIGSSGAGGKPSLSTHFSERYNVVRPYKLAGHRHSAEIEQVLSELTGDGFKVSMSAHAVNMVRGILCTCHLFSTKLPEVIDIWRVYRSTYSKSYFIRLVRERRGPFRLPDPKLVIGSNFCDIGFDIDSRSNRIVAVAATDNLIKGAAGNAVQVMNIMYGIDEKSGINQIPLHPV